MKLISIEDQIIKEVIRSLLNAGYTLSVNDGEEITVKRSMNPDRIFEAMKTTDEDRLIVHEWADAKRIGWIYFVYGNDDTEVISDYTVSLEWIMAPIFKLIDEYEARS